MHKKGGGNLKLKAIFSPRVHEARKNKRKMKHNGYNMSLRFLKMKDMYSQGQKLVLK